MTNTLVVGIDNCNEEDIDMTDWPRATYSADIFKYLSPHDIWYVLSLIIYHLI